MSRSITHRLLISNLLILVAFLGLAGAALDRAFRNSAETAVREQLQAHVYTLLTAAQEDERGHMRLHARSIAISVGAPDDAVERIARLMVERGEIRRDAAERLLAAEA